MADNNKENRMSIDDFDFAHEDADDDTSMLVYYLVTRLHQAMGNPALQGEVQQQLHAYGILPPIQQERGPERFQGKTSKRGLSTEKGVENPYQELKQLLEGKPSSKKKGHGQHERSPSREREESKSSDESLKDVAPRQRRAQRSPTPTKWKRSPHSPHRHESKREEKSSMKKKERKRSTSSPSSSPSSSADEGKVLAFIQQFDAAFRDEGFTESSKLRHVAMHFQKSASQWWASLRANGEAPKTWKALRASIMKQFLASDAKDKVLSEWRSLKLSPYESIHKYVDKFWDLHLKATVYKKIDFEEQKQQFCAGLPEDMNEYVNSQRPRSISVVIYHTMVATRINFQQGAKRNLKPMEAKEKQEYKGKNFSQNSSKGNSNNNKAKEKGVFKECLVKSKPSSGQKGHYEVDELSTHEKAHISKDVLAQIRAHIFIAKFKDAEGDSIKTTIMPREIWTLHRKPEVVNAMRAIHIDKFFRLPPWGMDYMRAHKLMSSIQYDGQALLIDNDGSKVRVQIIRDIINDALHFYPRQYDLLAKTKSIDNEKAFIKAKGNKYKYSDMIYDTDKEADSKGSDNEGDSKGSDKEESQKGARAKGPSEHENSDEEDTSTPLDKKCKKPRSETQVAYAEAQAKVEERKKMLAEARAAKAATTKLAKPHDHGAGTAGQNRKGQGFARRKVEQKAQEVDLTSQSTHEPKEKAIVDLTGHIEHLKKIQRDKNLEEQRAAALAREKIKKGLKRTTE
ncbi:hypothetical protein L7F22_000344 [Adiantum nelumboides]|nr:hypothetical protein [Adiantum nelumboides]